MKKGSAIDIPAEVKGLPLPTIQWMKDDVVIEKPDEEKMTMETEEVKTLASCLFYSLKESTTALMNLPATQSIIHLIFFK